MNDLLTKQLKTLLERGINSKINSLSLNISDSLIRSIVSKLAQETAKKITILVTTSANQQLDTIPKNLLGTKNPVEITSSNTNSNQLTKVLSNVIDTKLTSQITKSLISAIENELKSSLPTDKKNLVNFTILTSSLNALLTPLVSTAVNTALKSFTSSIFSRSQPVPPAIPGVDSLSSFFSGDVDAALESIDDTYTSANANRFLQASKTFDVNNELNQEKLLALKQGFIDPEANYPTKEYEGKPDTNRLATGDVAGDSLVKSKIKERMLGAKLPGGESWDEPETTYKAEYPYNKVTQTETGHVFEVDDTPGAERLHLFHKAGTYVEIDSNGSMIRRIRGSSYEIIDRNGKISITGSADISVNGSCNIYVGNDANIEVEGDTNITCYNDITAQAAGNVNISARETLNLTGTDVNIQAYNKMNIKSEQELNIQSANYLDLYSNVEMSAHSTGIINFNSNTEITLQTVNFYTKTSQSTFNETGDSYHILTGGDFNADTGGVAHINSGNAQASKNSKVARVAGISNIGIISGRKDVLIDGITDPKALTLADEYSILNEEDNQLLKEKKAHRDKLVTAGLASPEELDRSPVTQKTITVRSIQSTTVPGSDSLKKATMLPGNYNLSPNFTLEMLSSKAAVTKDKIESSELTYGDIVFNLQQVALNILEPVYNLYPNMYVTSGFRNRSKSSSTSQHPLGHAVDIQFKGASKDEYFKIATQLAKVLKYDQFILEFSSYTNNPWIHISYTGKVDRLQVMTFWNNSRHSSGLTQLA